MSFLDYVTTSIRGLTSFPLRSVLMITGMAISVAALICLLAIGQGTKQEIKERITNVGTDLVIVRPKLSTQERVRNQLNTTLTTSDAEALARSWELPYVSAMSYQTTVRGELIHEGTTLGTLVTATEPGFEAVRDFYALEGRFINEQDEQRRASVVVLGRSVADQFGGPEAVLGDQVRMVLGPETEHTLIATVVGVMEPKGLAGPFDQDDQAIIPLSVAESRMPFVRNPLGKTNVHVILLQGSDDRHLTETRDTVRGLMLELHDGNEDFQIQTQEDLLARTEKTAMLFSILLGTIGGISLVVSAVGVAVAMLLIVSERTLEIGVRRAIGASRNAIMAQILADCVLMSVVGSGIGLGMALLVGYLVDGVEVGGEISLRLPLSLQIVALPCAVCVGVSLLAGLFPAYRASTVSPIDALRA